MIESAPALANSSTWRSGRSIIRWTSIDAARVVDQVGDRGDDQRADRDRRDEVAVHDVDVDDPGAGVEHLVDLRAEPGEVGGEDRGSDPVAVRKRTGGRHQIALSIDVSQPWQRMSWSELIRTIVWWVPQPGHCETSS